MSSLIKQIRESVEYKKFKKVLTLCRERIHIDRDRDEALALHSGRTSRKLYGTKRYSAKELIDASQNDLMCRSRLVEIRVQCSIQIDLLHDAIKSIKQFILTEYKDDLKAYTTVGDRQAFVERVAKAAIETEGEGQALIKLLDDLISDCDKASYHLRTTYEALNLLSGTKSGQVL